LERTIVAKKNKIDLGAIAECITTSFNIYHHLERKEVVNNKESGKAK